MAAATLHSVSSQGVMTGISSSRTKSSPARGIKDFSKLTTKTEGPSTIVVYCKYAERFNDYFS